MNILHVIPGLTWERGGPTVAVCALARHQAAAGHQVSLLTTDQGARSGEQAASVPDSVSVERLPVLGPDRVAYAPAFAHALRARLRTTDVVHVHSIFTYPVHAALREARAAGVPAVLRPCGQLHGYSLRRGRLQKRIYLALCGRRSAMPAPHGISPLSGKHARAGPGTTVRALSCPTVSSLRSTPLTAARRARK